MKFASTIFLAALICSAGANTFAKIQADIKDITRQVTEIDTTVSGSRTNGLTFKAGWAIFRTAGPLAAAISRATANVAGVNPCPVTEGDWNEVLTSLRELHPPIRDILSNIAAEKSAFRRFGMGSAAPNAIANIRDKVTTLGNTLIACAPVSLVDDGKKLQAAIDEEFSAVLDVYKA